MGKQPKEKPERVIEVLKRKIYNLSKPSLGSSFDVFPHEPIIFF